MKTTEFKNTSFNSQDQLMRILDLHLNFYGFTCLYELSDTATYLNEEHNIIITVFTKSNGHHNSNPIRRNLGIDNSYIQDFNYSDNSESVKDSFPFPRR